MTTDTKSRTSTLRTLLLLLLFSQCIIGSSCRRLRVDFFMYPLYVLQLSGESARVLQL